MSNQFDFARHTTEVFAGNELLSKPPAISATNAPCSLIGDNGSSIPLDEKGVLSKHIMLLGGIGTGKSNALYQMIDQLQRSMTGNDVMIIFDTKGDFREKFNRPGDIVISNDEFAKGARGKDYWNIFAEIEDDDHLEVNLREIATSLFYEKIHSSKQPFFPNAARDIFYGVLYHFIKQGDRDQLNNQALKEFFDQKATAEKLREIFDQYPNLRTIGSYISDDSSNQTQGVLTELHQLIHEIFVEKFAEEGNLSLRKLVREKAHKTIFVEYDLAIGNVLTPIYRLMFDLAIKEALSRKASEGNVYLIADEFRLIPHLQHIDNAVNFGRSLGIKVVIGIQNVEQLYDIYGQDRARSILSGFSTSITFRLNDHVSTQYIKNKFGSNRKKDTYLSTILTRGIIEEVREAHVIEDWNIANLKLGEAIIGLPYEQPFIFQFDEFK